MSEIITRFAAGAEIPEWLLVREPMKPHAPKGAFRFASAVRLIDLPECYLLLLETGETFIDDAGMADHRVSAATKPVTLVRSMSVILALGPLEVSGVLPPAIQPKASGEQVVRRDHWLRRLFGLAQRRQ